MALLGGVKYGSFIKAYNNNCREKIELKMKYLLDNIPGGGI